MEDKKYSFEYEEDTCPDYSYIYKGVSYPSIESIIAEQFNFCGCGDNSIALDYIYDKLKGQKEFMSNTSGPNSKVAYETREKLYHSEGEKYFFLYWLETVGLAEHGSSVNGCWLTEKGKNFLNDWELYKTENKDL